MYYLHVTDTKHNKIKVWEKSRIIFSSHGNGFFTVVTQLADFWGYHSSAESVGRYLSRYLSGSGPILPGPIVPGPIVPEPVLPGPIVPGPKVPGPNLSAAESMQIFYLYGKVPKRFSTDEVWYSLAL